MKPGGPWSVKGIEPHTREMAKHAARRSGMTLGEWLNTVISGNADETVDKKVAVGTMTSQASSSSIESFERATTRLEDIAQQLARIARQETDASSAYSYGAPSRYENESFTRLLNRVESNERQSVEAFSAVNERLSVLSRQFAQAAKAAASRPEDSPSFQTLEKAVRNIVEHMEASEKRNRDNFRSLQDRFADVSGKIQNTSSDQALRQAPAFTQLESRIGDLARRVETTQSSNDRALSEMVRSELQDLAGRIDMVRDSAEQLAARAQTQAVQASQQELRAIEQRILGLLNEAQATFRSSSGANPAELQRLHGDIEALNARIDEARKGLASDHDVRALRQAVEQLSTRVQQSSDSRPLVEMDRRIVELAQRLHDQQQYIHAAAQVPELEHRFTELEQRLSAGLNAQGDPAVHAALQQQIAQVSERMDRTEQQISHFSTIERAITQLYEGLEQTRNATKQVAEDAASRVAAQFSQQLASQSHASPVSLAGAPEIVALEQGLQALRESTHNADHRNQETLVAVHDTLEHIVSKLSELETAAIGQRVAAAVSAPAMAEVQAPEPQAFAVSEVSNPAPTPDAHTEELSHENASHVADLPREPQLEIPPSIAADTFAPRDSDDPIAPELPTVEDTEQKSGGTDDFIAAARRAAQAAQQQKSALSSISPTAAKLSEQGSRKLLARLKSPFQRKPKAAKDKKAKATVDLETPKPMPEIKPAQATVDAGKRRRLMLIGLLLLAAVPALLINFKSAKAPDPAPAQTTAPQPDAATPPAATTAPADKQSELLPAPEGVQQGNAAGNDELLTGSLPAPTPGSISEAVTAAPLSAEIADLPAEIGSAKLKSAAASGDATAQFIIATRFLDGKGVDKDPAQAAYWFGKAAAGGLVPAQYRTATMYERGLGVEKDIKAALAWYERAAALGNVRSMHNAAVIAAGNEAGAPDYARAFKWFSLASSHGLKDSQFNLAVLLERGLGTQADVVDAAFWYLAAGAQSDDDAQRRADLLMPTLPDTDVAQIKARLKSWKPLVAPREANVFDGDERSYDDKSSALDVPQLNQQAAISKHVGRAQALLQTLGYNTGAITGTVNPRTTAAIRLFQIEQGLVADGRLTPALMQTLETVAG